MKSPSFLNYENFKFGRFSQLLKAKFQNNKKSSSVEDLRNELTSPKFEKKLMILLKNDLAKDYSQQTIEEVLNKISLCILQDNEIETPEDEPGIKIPVPKINYIVENGKIDEILKVQKRVPRWFKNPNQINTKILLAFMELMGDNNSVSYYKLETSCRSLETFKNNYIQMKSFGERNHAKVFEEAGSRITLWEPTREYVKKEYMKFLKRRNNN